MELIEKATKTKFQTDVKHEPIRPKVPKHRREPSPHRYLENEEEIGEEEEEQPQQHSPAAQTGTEAAQQQEQALIPNQETHKSIYWDVQEPERYRNWAAEAMEG